MRGIPRRLGWFYCCSHLDSGEGAAISRMTAKPLQALELAAGDFRDKPRKTLIKDEIGHLADTVVNMRTSLR